MAKAFRFRLDPWLRVLKAREVEQQREVGTRVREAQRVETVLASLARESERARELVRGSRSGARIDAAREMQGLRWGAHLVRRAKCEEESLRGALASLEEARRELIERSRAAKVVEKLREKRQEVYQAELDRLERAESDEVGVQLYARRRTMGLTRSACDIESS